MSLECHDRNPDPRDRNPDSRPRVLQVMKLALSLRAGLCVLMIPAVLPAAPPTPSYARDVRPFFARYCLECHNPDKLRGGLSLETFKTLQAGGDNGPVLLPGKPDESNLVLQV